MEVAPETASSNGSEPTGAQRPSGPLERLRETPTNVHLLRGFGPLVVGVVLFVLMVALAPSVAPERTVERPVDGAASTSTTQPVEPTGDQP